MAHWFDVVERFYYGNSTANEIAADLELPGQRRVYTIINRALRRLRIMIDQESPDASELMRSDGGED